MQLEHCMWKQNLLVLKEGYVVSRELERSSFFVAEVTGRPLIKGEPGTAKRY